MMPLMPRPSRSHALVLATRPKTLPAAIAPIVVGSAVAASVGELRPVILVATLLAALLIQIGANLANDLFDFRRGVDTPGRLGPPRVTQSGLLSEREMALATAAAFGLATAIGLGVAALAGWQLIVVGALCLAVALAYSAGPFPLGSLGLGAPAVFVFFGPVAVAGTAFAQTGRLIPAALAASVPIGLLATAILVVNDLRDRDTDRAAGKLTLAARLGPVAARTEYLVLLVVAYATPVALRLADRSGGWYWLPWLSLPLAVRVARLVLVTDGRALDRALAWTASLLLAFAALLAASLLR